MAIIRTRTKGNFLYKIYMQATESTQFLLKEKLIEQDLWENFNRVQTLESKKSNFDAIVIGICSRILIINCSIKNDFLLTDLGKLMKYYSELTGKELENEFKIAEV